MRLFTEREHILAAVGTWSGIGHAQCTLAVVLERRDELVLELGAVDGASTTSSSSWITT